jgi:predicted dienelactone hydrolase
MHFVEEALVLIALPLRHALGGNKAFLPVAVEQQALFRRVQDVALVVVRLLGKRILLDDAQVRQYFAHMHDSGDGSGK